MKRASATWRTCTATAVVLAGLTLAAGPAQSQSIPDFFVDESKLPFDALPGTTTDRYWGVHKNAGYRIEVPHDWNGDLVMFAHGYRGLGPELQVSNPRIREYLVTSGFAWAASSFSKNRYAVKAGVQDTLALAMLFNGLVGKPGRTFITGRSMGGHISGVAVEQYPEKFDGALPMCGAMGDAELFDYFLDFNLVAQALAGVDAQFPPPPDYLSSVVPAVVGALGPAYPIVLNDAGEKLKAVMRNISGGERPAFDFGFYVWNSDLTAPAPGIPFLFPLGVIATGTISGMAAGNATGNADSVYQFDSDPALTPEEAELNNLVLRVTQDPQGRHPDGLANIPPISGDIGIPVVSIHTLGDLFVPFSMEQIYARRVAAQGKSGLLVSRAIRDVGHCAFAVEEIEQAFADLIDWVDTGARPEGDDVLDPAKVADPDFGCTFTLFDRPFLPACP